MDTLVFLGRTLGFSVAAGVNLYATVALIGLASRFGWVTLPSEYAIFDNDWVIGIAARPLRRRVRRRQSPVGGHVMGHRSYRSSGRSEEPQ